MKAWVLVQGLEAYFAFSHPWKHVVTQTSLDTLLEGPRSSTESSEQHSIIEPTYWMVGSVDQRIVELRPRSPEHHLREKAHHNPPKWEKNKNGLSFPELELLIEMIILTE